MYQVLKAVVAAMMMGIGTSLMTYADYLPVYFFGIALTLFGFVVLANAIISESAQGVNQAQRFAHSGRDAGARVPRII
jgi:hypothetical protein